MSEAKPAGSGGPCADDPAAAWAARPTARPGLPVSGKAPNGVVASSGRDSTICPKDGLARRRRPARAAEGRHGGALALQGGVHLCGEGDHKDIIIKKTIMIS